MALAVAAFRLPAPSGGTEGPRRLYVHRRVNSGAKSPRPGTEREIPLIGFSPHSFWSPRQQSSLFREQSSLFQSQPKPALARDLRAAS